MSEIPEDVKQIAHAVRDKTCVDSECTFAAGCGCLDAIAHAIMAERERCARICDEIGSGLMDMTPQEAAKAIRRGN